MLTFYHNPKCGKSRMGLALVEQSQQKFEVIHYLKQPPTQEELQSIIQKLGIKPLELVRTKETVWVEHFKGKPLTDAQLIEAMVQHPILIERPILVSDTQAVLGRPPEKLELFLHSFSTKV